MIWEWERDFYDYDDDDDEKHANLLYILALVGLVDLSLICFLKKKQKKNCAKKFTILS